MADQDGTARTSTTAPRGPGLVVRLTEAERAAGYGRTAAWVRSVVADRLAGRGPAASPAGSGQRPARSPGGAGLAPDVAAALGRIGNSVNQLARAANVAERAGEVSPLTVQMVEALRVEVAQLRDELRGGVGGRG